MDTLKLSMPVLVWMLLGFLCFIGWLKQREHAPQHSIATPRALLFAAACGPLVWVVYVMGVGLAIWQGFRGNVAKYADGLSKVSLIHASTLKELQSFLVFLVRDAHERDGDTVLSDEQIKKATDLIQCIGNLLGPGVLPDMTYKCEGIVTTTGEKLVAVHVESPTGCLTLPMTQAENFHRQLGDVIREVLAK